MTTTAKPSHRSLPRQPSRRNHALYRAYKIDGRSQTELAEQFGLTQGRVSQIIRRFEEWRAIGAPTGTCDSLGKPQSAARSHDESLRLERWLEHERAEAIFVRAIRAFDHAPRHLTATRTEKRPSGDVGDVLVEFKHVESKRKIATSAQFLRLARQASNDLGRLADKEPPPQPELETTDEQRLAAIREHLGHLRRKAEANNEVAKSEFPRDIINYWLAAFLGDHEIWIDPADLTPGSPLHELLNFFNPNRDAWEGEAPAEPSTTPDSVPGSSLGPHCTEAPASSLPDATGPSSLPTHHSPTHHSPSSPITLENPAIPTPLPSNTSNKPNTHITPSPTPRSAPSLNPEPRTLNPHQRRLEHERKLEQLKEARRLGLPCHFVFDPEDGPLPPPPSQPGDYHIVQPGPY